MPSYLCALDTENLFKMFEDFSQFVPKSSIISSDYDNQLNFCNILYQTVGILTDITFYNGNIIRRCKA